MGVPQFQQQAILTGNPVVNQAQTFTDICDEANGTAAGAGVPILGADFAVPATGTVNVHVALQKTAAAAVFQLTVDGANYGDMNSGAQLAPGARYGFSLPVKAGQSINFQTDAATTLLTLTAMHVANQ